MRWIIAVPLLAASVLYSLLPLSAGEPETNRDSADSDVQDVVFLGRQHPVFIRLHLQRDEKSFRTAWRDFAEMMFRELDANRDGTLAGAEWDAIPSPDLLVIGNPHGAPQGAESVRENIDVDPQDGQVSLQEFSAYLLQVGAGPFSLDGRYSRVTSGSPYPDDFLFREFDADSDGRLSRTELARAAELFRKLDRDDDEIVTRVEIQSPNAPFAAFVQPVAPAQRPGRQEVPFLSVGTGRQLDAVIDALLQNYAHNADLRGKSSEVLDERRVKTERLALPREQVAPFDSDANGELDQRELRRLLEHGAWSVQVTLRSGARTADKPPVDIACREEAPQTFVRPARGGGMSLVLPGVELIFGADASSSGSRREAALRLFKGADADKNGYLERTEVRRNPFLGQAFDALDADGDGKLFEKELTMYVEQREAASHSRTALTAQLQGPGLFDVLDLDHDGRLGLREVLNASRRIQDWDRDGDETVSPAEMPVVYQLTVGGDQFQLPGAVPEVVPRPAPTSPAGDPRGGPDWFRRMDKNRDGDISRREFLGSRDLFKRLDVNRDDLVSVEEADAKP